MPIVTAQLWDGFCLRAEKSRSSCSRVASLFISFICGIAAPTRAQDETYMMPDVTVRGAYGVATNWFQRWNGFSYFPNATPSMILSMGRLANHVTKDVRCYEGAGNVTTSLADPTARWGIASHMASAARASGALRGPGSVFTVTWADGGSTSYRVIGGFGGAALATVETRHNPSDGLLRSGPVCARG